MTKSILTEDNIHVQIKLKNKEEAIRKTGLILVEKGYVHADYVEKMFERELLSSTYMGNGVAIPHGTEDAKAMVIHSGLCIVQVPEGVDFGGGQIAKVIIGIAGKNTEHLDILSKVALICSDEQNIQKIITYTSASEIFKLFNEVK